MSTALRRKYGSASAEYQMHIGGRWRDAQTGAVRHSIDPFTGAEWAVVPEASAPDVNEAVVAAREAFDSGPWPRMTGKKRGQYIRRLAELIDREAERLAFTETRDNGKLIREMLGQLHSLPDWFEYFAGWADKIEGEVLPTDKPNFFVYTRREPVGVAAAIVAWNSPLLLTTYKLAPALAAGCTFILKPAEQAPASCLELARLVEEAEFPPGVINVITGDGPTAGAALVAHPGVDKIAFTGSTAVGIDIARSAATHLAKTSLELGGKSAQLIFADADIESAVSGVAAGVFAASGQTCVAGSRVLVEASIVDEFTDRLVAAARKIRLGDPADPETEMGPLAFKEHFEKVAGYIDIGREAGAKVLAGGGRPESPELRDGLFIEPTVLGSVENSDQLAQEEIFGPVAMVMPFTSEDEAIAMANDVEFGLAAGVWTKSVSRAHRAAARLRVGTVWVNSYRVDSFSVPCGGRAMSGYGREGGKESLREYLQLKTVWVETHDEQRDPFVLG
jgi:aldehyde dehydrogenase (NAD+)